MLRRLRTWLSVVLVLILCAFSRPEQGDLIELEGFLNARTEAKFRTTDLNRAYVLPRGTRAQVEEVQQFATGNYGMRIRILNANGVQSGQTLWVYYNVNSPSMKLFSMRGNETTIREQLAHWESDPKVQAQAVGNPTQASETVVTRDTPAIVAPPLTVTPPAPATPPAGATPAEAVNRVFAMNRAVRQADPSPVDCADCRGRLAQYPTCTAQNNYLETQMDRLQGRTVVSDLLSTTPRYPRLEACVRESMSMTNGSFAVCQLGQPEVAGRTVRACTSERLVRVVQNSLSLSVDCLAGYLNGADGNQDRLKETFRNTVALVNLESGFHTNAISSTGASGLGQITNGATQWVNRTIWPNIQNYIQQSNNPSCQTMKNMNLRQATPYQNAACERMSLESGNPIVNMIYTIAHMKMVRTEIEGTLNRGLRDNDVRLTPAQHEQLLGALTNWGHNTGAYGMRVPLSSLLNKDSGIAALKAGNVDQFLTLLQAEVHSFHVQPSQTQGRSAEQVERRATEASQFYQYVQNKMNLLERKVGRACTP